MNLPVQSMRRESGPSNFSAYRLDCLTKFRVILTACGTSLKQRTEVIMNYSTLKSVLLFYVDVSGGAECQASWVETCKIRSLLKMYKKQPEVASAAKRVVRTCWDRE